MAEMIGKRHDNLVRDIKKYVEELGKLKIQPTDFFQESTYKTTQNKEVPRDIRRYIGNLNEGKISHVEFFENSTFQDERSNN